MRERMRKIRADKDSPAYKSYRESIKTWVKRNVNKRSKYTQKYRAQQQTWLRNYRLDKGCQHCGEKHPACLEFHHVDPSQKDGALADVAWSIERMKREVAKCVVLCSNCHRKEHHRLDLLKVNESQ